MSITRFNCHPHTTHADVLQVLDECLKKLEDTDGS